MPQHPPMKRRATRQQGVILFLAIIVLVAMSLAALALMRSVFTGNKVAGNLAFQQSATQSADVGVETAVSWLEQNRLGSTLFNDINGTSTTTGYYSTRQDPSSTQTWATWWATLPANRINAASKDASGNPQPDQAGNTVRYVIQRLCNASGDPTTNIGCQTAPNVNVNQGFSQGNDPHATVAVAQYYYRVTAQVTGARGTVAYVQVVIAM